MEPITYHYIISELCNMKCTYCNVDVDNNIRLDNKFFDNFKKSHLLKENFILDIFGGEVFLQLDVLEYIINSVSKMSNLISINITTNGTIFNERVKQIVNSPKVHITISHDSVKQNIHRGTNKLYIKEFVNEGVTLSHNMIVGNDFNYFFSSNYLILSHKYLREIGLQPNITIVRDIGTWTSNQVKTFLYQYREYVNYILNIEFKDYKSTREVPGLLGIYLYAILNYHINGSKQPKCSAGKNFFAVTPKGKIVSCERFERDVNNIVHMKDYDMVMTKCNSCDIQAYCHQGCNYEQLKNNGPIDELCEIYIGIVGILKDLLKDDKEYKIMKLYDKE